MMRRWEHPANAELREIRAAHRLTHAQIAALTCTSLHGVLAWFRAPGSAAYRNMPGAKLELLRLQCRKPLTQEGSGRHP